MFIAPLFQKTKNIRSIATTEVYFALKVIRSSHELTSFGSRTPFGSGFANLAQDKHFNKFSTTLLVLHGFTQKKPTFRLAFILRFF